MRMSTDRVIATEVAVTVGIAVEGTSASMTLPACTAPTLIRLIDPIRLAEKRARITLSRAAGMAVLRRDGNVAGRDAAGGGAGQAGAVVSLEGSSIPFTAGTSDRLVAGP